MKLRAFIRHIKTVYQKVNNAARKPFRAEVSVILGELKRRSPVDTGTYRESWKARNAGRSGKVIDNVVFYNEDPKFSLMEFGADPNEPPWYFPQRNSGSGKLTLSRGRVWAGGLDPGHGLTIGGAINPVLSNYKYLQLGERISEVAVKRF